VKDHQVQRSLQDIGFAALFISHTNGI
jgi:hypothetical protein